MFLYEFQKIQDRIRIENEKKPTNFSRISQKQHQCLFFLQGTKTFRQKSAALFQRFIFLSKKSFDFD